MWLTSSSVGRKLVMAVTGVCLVLFVTFHVLMNGVAIFWPAGYNAVCAFLGANWYALVASIGLAALFIIHIIYALWLTLQNRKARGNDRYAVTSKPKQVEWASQNMLVLGIVVLAFLVVHMIQFWAKMQLAEILGQHDPDPANGMYFINAAFSCWVTPVVYIIGFIALWFHMTHGFWSMFQSAGWDNDTWLPRLKCIANWWTSLVVALFIAEALVFTVNANNGNYANCPIVSGAEVECCEAAEVVVSMEGCAGHHHEGCTGNHEGCASNHEGCEGNHEGCTGNHEGCAGQKAECTKCEESTEE